MTDIMMLDLSTDDGLLVPFHRSAEPVTSDREAMIPTTNDASTNNSSRGLSRFLFSRRPPPEPPKQEEKLPLKVTTFAFPKARAEVAETLSEPYKEKEPQDEDSDDGSDEDDSSDDEDSEINKEKPRRKKETAKADPPPKRSLRNLDDWDPNENPWQEEKTETRSWRMEGIGSTPEPLNDNESKGFVGLWRSLRGHNHRRRGDDDDLRSMKVATEDTKDDKTLLEQIGKAALVVMVPELYADIEDGDGNLGMYRSVALNADDDAEASSHDDVATNLRTELNQLRLKVLRLEKALKNSELEVNSWKLRCNEVETELRRYKGRSDDDSSVEADEGGQHDLRENGDDEEEEDDGIEEQWSGYSSVKEGILLDMQGAKLDFDSEVNNASRDLMGDGEASGTGTSSTTAQKVAADDEPDLMDLKEDKIVFDPLAK